MPDTPTLEELYQNHSQRLYSFLLGFLRSEADTKDVLQQVFLKIARKSNLLAGVEDEAAFLLRLAHNEAIDLCRRRGTREMRQEAWESKRPDYFEDITTGESDDLRKEISEAMDELPPDQRAVLELKLWQEMTFVQIAQVLDISANTAASRYRYALDKLQTRLRPGI